jgi:phosphoglycerate dehydrogenase-like enzyme
MSSLLITREMLINEKHLKRLREALPDIEMDFCPDSDPTPEQLARADFILGRPDPALLKHCKNLKLLQLRSAGADKYIHGEVPEGVILATSGGSLGHSVGEHMVAMLLALMKHLDAYSRNMPEGIWKDAGPARTIVDSTTLILGLGSLGTEFAWRMKALGSRVVGLRRSGTDKPEYVDELYLSERLDELLPRADILAVFLPSTSATQNIMDRRRLGLMKDDAFILNGGRGSAIDQEALCDLMEAGKFAGAGLDVTVPEPLPSSHRLWKTPRVLVCPHIAGTDHLAETLDYIIEIAAHNVSACLSGGEIISEIDRSAGYRKVPKKLPKPLSLR